jgi:hypothetical protein
MNSELVHTIECNFSRDFFRQSSQIISIVLRWGGLAELTGYDVSKNSNNDLHIVEFYFFFSFHRCPCIYLIALLFDRWMKMSQQYIHVPTQYIVLLNFEKLSFFTLSILARRWNSTIAVILCHLYNFFYSVRFLFLILLIYSRPEQQQQSLVKYATWTLWWIHNSGGKYTTVLD